MGVVRETNSIHRSLPEDVARDVNMFQPPKTLTPTRAPEVPGADEGHHRPEDLSPGGGGPRVHVGKEGRADEVALAFVTMSDFLFLKKFVVDSAYNEPAPAARAGANRRRASTGGTVWCLAGYLSTLRSQARNRGREISARASAPAALKPVFFQLGSPSPAVRRMDQPAPRGVPAILASYCCGRLP